MSISLHAYKVMRCCNDLLLHWNVTNLNV